MTTSPAEPPESTLECPVCRSNRVTATEGSTWCKCRDCQAGWSEKVRYFAATPTAARIAQLEADLAAAEAKLGAVEALADEWAATVYKLSPGHPMTVNEFCRYWFTAPIRAALTTQPPP